MNCDDVLASGVIEAYLHGRLPPGARDEFERHFFGCDRCTAALQTHLAMRSVLTREAAGTAPAAAPRVPVWRWAAAAAVLLGALTGALLWRETRVAGPRPTAADPAERSGGPAEAGPGPAEAGRHDESEIREADRSRPPRDSGRSERVALLARVDPPPYVARTLRGAGEEGSERFGAAMARYQAGDYQGAVAGLREAARLAPAAEPHRFYLGVVLLLTDRPDEAVAVLAPLAAGDSAWAEEALFHLAKAHLALEQVPPALAALDRVVALEGDRRDEAAALRRAIQELPPR
jgi:anti-sigma factor RsiW